MSSTKGPQIIAALTGCIGGFCLGNAIGWSSPARPNIVGVMYVSPSEFDWISSIFTLGAALSVAPVPFIMDKYGRKYLMIIIGVLLALSWILMGMARSTTVFMLGRICCGLFSGSFCVVSPVYTAEVVEAGIRGALGACFQLFIVFGIFYMYVIGLMKSTAALSYVSAVFPILLIILMIFLPDTPTYLISANKDDEKINASYRFLRGKKYDFEAEKSLLISQLAEAEARKSEGVWSKFKQRTCVKAFCICMLLASAQQFSGINIVMFNAQDLFDKSGSSISSDVAAVIMGLGQVFGTLVSVVATDKAGRKILMITSLVSMAFCLISLGVYSYFLIKDSRSVASLGIFPVVIITIYVIAFSLGAGPLPWAILGEMFSPEVKGVASSICAGYNWMLAFMITITYQIMINAFQLYGLFWFYGILSIICAVLVFFFVLETKNKTLQEIQELL